MARSMNHQMVTCCFISTNIHTESPRGCPPTPAPPSSLLLLPLPGVLPSLPSCEKPLIGDWRLLLAAPADDDNAAAAAASPKVLLALPWWPAGSGTRARSPVARESLSHHHFSQLGQAGSSLVSSWYLQFIQI